MKAVEINVAAKWNGKHRNEAASNDIHENNIRRPNENRKLMAKWNENSASLAESVWKWIMKIMWK